MRIKKWLRTGNLDVKGLSTSKGVLEMAGRLLDKAYSSDIVGEVLFVGKDGKTYVGTVEFCINEANPEYVKAVIEK